MVGADKGPALAVLFDYSGLSSFVEREAVMAVVRGAIARGVRVVTVADPATEPFLRIAAAAASTAPSVEDGSEPSRPPLVVVDTGSKQSRSDRPSEEEQQPDPWIERWPNGDERFRGLEAENLLARALDRFGVSVLVGIGDDQLQLHPAKVRAAMKGEPDIFHVAPSQALSGETLHIALDKMFVEALRDLTDELSEDKEVNQTLFSELSAATSVVLAIQAMLTRHFGKISNRSAETDEQSS